MRVILIEEFAGVEDALWVEGIFDLVMKLHGGVAEGLSDPGFLGETNAVLTANDTTITDDPGEEPVECSVCFLFDHRISVVLHHDVGVDVAVASMAKACDGDACVVL